MMLTRLTTAMAALCFSLGAMSPALAADASSGSFYNASQNGHGFVFEVLEDGSVLMYWYTYRPDGTSTFLVGVGAQDGDSYSGALSQTNGMVFGDFDPSTNETFPWGSFTATFTDCDTVEVSWESDIDGYSAGSTTIQRLTRVKGANCANSPVNSNFALTLTSAAGIEKGEGVFLPDGTFAITHTDIATPKAGFGTWEMIDDATFSFEGTSYINNDSNPIPISGTATLTADGFESITDQQVLMEAARIDSTQVDLAQASMEGDYDITDLASGFLLGSGSMTAAGEFSGSIFSCVLTGDVLVHNGDFNQFGMNVPISGCYDGLLQGGGTVAGDGSITVYAADTTNGGGFLLKLVPTN